MYFYQYKLLSLAFIINLYSNFSFKGLDFLSFNLALKESININKKKRYFQTMFVYFYFSMKIISFFLYKIIHFHNNHIITQLQPFFYILVLENICCKMFEGMIFTGVKLTYFSKSSSIVNSYFLLTSDNFVRVGWK